MMRGLAGILCLVAVAAVQNRANVGITLKSDLDGSKSPVQKVIGMLKDMQANLKSEYDEDEAMFKKIACWCHDNTLEKGFQIEDGEAEVARLTKSIEEGEAKKAQLEEEVASLKKEIADNVEELAKAQKIRDEELAAFRKQEQECGVNLQAVNGAIEVLSKHMQAPEKSGVQAAKDRFKYSDVRGGQGPIGGQEFMQARLMSQSAIVNLKDIITRQSDSDSANQVVSALQTGFAGSEIFGILEQIRDRMGQDCGLAADEEKQRAETFAALKAAKEEQISAAKKAKDEKEKQLAATLQKLAEDKMALDDASKKLQSDKEFLATVEKSCTDTDGQWEERKKARLAEMQAVAETIGFLTSDEAKQTFAKTMGVGAPEEGEEGAVSFLQVNMKALNARNRAADLLRKTAFKTKDEALLEIAATVKLDAFTRVKEAINKMIATLTQEQSDEVKYKDWCVSEIQSNEEAISQEERNIEITQRQIDETTANMERLSQEIAQLNKDISSLKLEMQKSTEQRVKESNEYQMTFQDQEATQKVIKMAMDRLQSFYNKQALLQQVPKSNPNAIEAPSPPGKMQDYKKASGQSNAIISTMQDLINDSVVVQNDATNGEQANSDAYTKFMHESNQNWTDMENAIVSKSREKADAEKALVEQQGALQDHNDEKATLETYRGKIHGQCDFVIKNFDVRQDARQQEIEALQEALNIVSGAFQGN